MTRHPFRWDSLAFGAFFLAIVGNWAVWKEDLLTPRELTLSASGVLILLGVLGIVATLWRARPARPPAPIAQQAEDIEEVTTTQEGDDDEETASKP